MRVESVVRSDSSPQPCENSLDQRDITAINRSSGWAEAAEPTIPTERLAVSSCTGVMRVSVYILRQKSGELRKIGAGRTCAVPEGTRTENNADPALARWAKMFRAYGARALAVLPSTLTEVT